MIAFNIILILCVIMLILLIVLSPDIIKASNPAVGIKYTELDETKIKPELLEILKNYEIPGNDKKLNVKLGKQKDSKIKIYNENAKWKIDFADPGYIIGQPTKYNYIFIYRHIKNGEIKSIRLLGSEEFYNKDYQENLLKNISKKAN